MTTNEKNTPLPQSNLQKSHFEWFWGREGRDAPHTNDASIRALKLVRYLRLEWGLSAGAVRNLVAVANFYIDREQDLSIKQGWSEDEEEEEAEDEELKSSDTAVTQRDSRRNGDGEQRP